MSLDPIEVAAEKIEPRKRKNSVLRLADMIISAMLICIDLVFVIMILASGNDPFGVD